MNRHIQPNELANVIALLRQEERELQRWEQRHPVERVTLQAVQWLTRAPDRFSAALLTPLFDQGISSEQAINLLAWSGLCGWLNRLKIALGRDLLTDPLTERALAATERIA